MPTRHPPIPRLWLMTDPRLGDAHGTHWRGYRAAAG